MLHTDARMSTLWQARKFTSHFEKPVSGHQAFGDGVKDQMSCPKVNRIQLQLQEVRQDLFNNPTVQQVSWQEWQHL